MSWVNCCPWLLQGKEQNPFFFHLHVFFICPNMLSSLTSAFTLTWIWGPLLPVPSNIPPHWAKPAILDFALWFVTILLTFCPIITNTQYVYKNPYTKECLSCLQKCVGRISFHISCSIPLVKYWNTCFYLWFKIHCLLYSMLQRLVVSILRFGSSTFMSLLWLDFHSSLSQPD